MGYKLKLTNINLHPFHILNENAVNAMISMMKFTCFLYCTARNVTAIDKLFWKT